MMARPGDAIYQRGRRETHVHPSGESHVKSSMGGRDGAVQELEAVEAQSAQLRRQQERQVLADRERAARASAQAQAARVAQRDGAEATWPRSAESSWHRRGARRPSARSAMPWRRIGRRAQRLRGGGRVGPRID